MCGLQGKAQSMQQVAIGSLREAQGGYVSPWLPHEDSFTCWCQALQGFLNQGSVGAQEVGLLCGDKEVGSVRPHGALSRLCDPPPPPQTRTQIRCVQYPRPGSLPLTTHVLPSCLLSFLSFLRLPVLRPLLTLYRVSGTV